MKIADLVEELRAKGFKVSTHSARVFEKRGLLPEMHRERGERRNYDDRDIWFVKNVLVLRSFGMSIPEIKVVHDYIHTRGINVERDNKGEFHVKFNDAKNEVGNALIRGSIPTGDKLGVLEEKLAKLLKVLRKLRDRVNHMTYMLGCVTHLNGLLLELEKADAKLEQQMG